MGTGTITEPDSEYWGKECDNGTPGCPYHGEKHACVTPKDYAVSAREDAAARAVRDAKKLAAAAASLELESPTSPTALAARIVDLQGEIRDLRVRLFGDEDAEELYAENRRTYVTPNIPKPEPGMLASLTRHLTDQDDAFTKGIKALVGRVEKLEQLRAFFAPMLENKNPPLDGALIASRQDLDDALTRIAGVLRDEMSAAVHFTAEITSKFGAVTRERSTAHPIEWARQLVQLRTAHVIDKLEVMWKFVAEEQTAKNQPSRLQLARRAIATVIAGRER